MMEKAEISEPVEKLRQKLYDREHQLANLINNIPGGVHQCVNDPNLTLLSMSDGFLSMLGYSKDEIHSLFQHRYINMVYPIDRNSLMKNTENQLAYGNDIELEYRVLCKYGDPIWVLDKGRLVRDEDGNQSFYCVLIDIAKRKSQEEEFRLLLERHQVIIDQTTDIIFEWDIRKDTLTFSSNFYKKFGYNATEKQISHRLPISENIHTDDISSFVRIMKDIASGTPYSETEFRIKNIHDKFLWCRIRATAQYNSDNKPIKAIGVILDIDHFKSVNDTYSHPYGDYVLTKVAETLTQNTRSTDLVGRIGGGSMGVTVFNSQSGSYNMLYKCADRALYQRKNNGRNGVTLILFKNEH